MIYSTANVTSILFPSAAERRRTASDYPVRISGRRGRCIVRCKSQRIKGSGPKENFGGKLLIRGRQARTSSRKIHAGGRGGVTTRGATGTRSPPGQESAASFTGSPILIHECRKRPQPVPYARCSENFSTIVAGFGDNPAVRTVARRVRGESPSSKSRPTMRNLGCKWVDLFAFPLTLDSVYPECSRTSCNCQFRRFAHGVKRNIDLQDAALLHSTESGVPYFSYLLKPSSEETQMTKKTVPVVLAIVAGQRCRRRSLRQLRGNQPTSLTPSWDAMLGSLSAFAERLPNPSAGKISERAHAR
jgi:hypothetical protein